MMMVAFFRRTARKIAHGLIRWLPTQLRRWVLRLTARSPPPYINLVFVRHAECMHTAAQGLPSAIMAKYFDSATRDAVAPLVQKFDSDPLRAAHGLWKAAAAASPYAVLTKADTPLLPSELLAKTHEPRLAKTFDTLAPLQFAVAAPPLLRCMTTAALVAKRLPACCLVSPSLLPRPSPLHALEDVQALKDAAIEVLETLLADDESDDEHRCRDDIAPVLGPVSVHTSDERNAAVALVREVLSAVEAYLDATNAGFFERCAPAAGAPASPQAAFADWAFAECAGRGTHNLVVFGGSGWWAGLVDRFGAGLSPSDREAVLPKLALRTDVLGDDGRPLEIPLLPPPAGARYARLIRRDDGGYTLALPTAGAADSDAFAAAATELNPAPPPAALSSSTAREAWLRGLLASGEACSY